MKMIRMLLFLISVNVISYAQVVTGADQLMNFQDTLKKRSFAIMLNHTSKIGKRPLLDSILDAGIKPTLIFVPEHGLSGIVSAGEAVSDTLWRGIPVISLYGNQKKPLPEHLSNIDLILFDIQDVGVRFYTYISSLHYIMEACAENNVPLWVLDRPNPLGDAIDGPILEKKFHSFVGMHPIPIVYGMTIGELATMINGEQWLSTGKKCNLKVIPLQNWTHGMEYFLSTPPSPNLTSQQAIYNYPTLGLFEGTTISVGRGTAIPFEQVGHLNYDDTAYSFTPQSLPWAKKPPFENQKTFGKKVALEKSSGISISLLLHMYAHVPQDQFFNSFFEKLAGTDLLRQQIQNKVSAQKIKNSWRKGLKSFKKIREKYLMY